jgi:hypothetical protein
MVWVAAAGPGMNLALAIGAALLIHAVGYLPLATGQWVMWNLVNAININVIPTLHDRHSSHHGPMGRVARVVW